jgi:hypothetical protein
MHWLCAHLDKSYAGSPADSADARVRSNHSREKCHVHLGSRAIELRLLKRRIKQPPILVICHCFVTVFSSVCKAHVYCLESINMGYTASIVALTQDILSDDGDSATGRYCRASGLSHLAKSFIRTFRIFLNIYTYRAIRF